jgi:hypothetical protein
VCVRSELLLEAQERFINWQAARAPPPRSLQLTITIRASNLTYAVPEGGEAAEGEPTPEAAAPPAAEPPITGEDGEIEAVIEPTEPAEPIEPVPKDLILLLAVTENDSIADINRIIQVSIANLCYLVCGKSFFVVSSFSGPCEIG